MVVKRGIRVKHIVIDPGHGGRDPGAVGHGLKEKDIALFISLGVAKLLEAAGFSVVLTRTADIFVALSPARTPPCDISVSIHVNAGGGQGLETWVSLFNRPAASRKLGQAIHRNILKRVPFKDRGLKTKKNSAGNADYLYMLRRSRGVPVLVECGFIDSPADAAILKSQDNLRKIAGGIVAGILEYCGVRIQKEVFLGMFKDIVGHWAQGDIEYLAKIGVISGKGGGIYDPNAPITRAEAASVISRAIKYVLAETQKMIEEVR